MKTQRPKTKSTKKAVDFRNFDLNLLRVFVTLMDELSVSRAADRLGLTQSATSNALARLRQSLNDDLLVRRGNMMTPTQTARDFMPFAQTALRSIQSGLDEIEEFDPASLKGTINIGFDQYSFAILGQNLLTFLRKTAPNLRVSIIIASPHASEDQLHSGQLDFIIGQVWKPVPRIEKDILFIETFVGLVRKGHPILASKGRVTLDEFLSYPHILFSEVGRVRRNIDTALSQIGRDRIVNLTLPSLSIGADVAERTDDILNLGLRMSHTIRQTHALEVFELPLIVPPFNVALSWSEQNAGTAKNEWFRSIVGQINKSDVVES